MYSLVNEKCSLCDECYGQMKPVFEKFMVDDLPAITIYHYDEFIKTYLFQFKGCYDIELKNIFLERYHRLLRLWYRNYYLVPAPSYEEENQKREFNHVVEIFKILDLPFLFLLEKSEPFKQAEHSASERRNISDVIKLKSNASLTNKNILLVDDVYTTGATMKAMIKLVSSLHPKRIKILVMAKTEEKNEVKLLK